MHREVLVRIEGGCCK